MKITMFRPIVLAVTAIAMSWMSVDAQVYNVMNYGATGDGKTLDHEAINAAIDAATNAGGGQVVLPAGTYLCGSIRLKSNVDLHLMHGAVIQASPAEMMAYDAPEQFEASEYQCGGLTYIHNSLIWAEGQNNISITGHGMINGTGLTKLDTENKGEVTGGSVGIGDKSIALKLCRKVVIKDITIYHAGHFAIIATGCDLGTVDNVTVDTNRDGIDIVCCRYWTVSNCKVNTPCDDGIVLKSNYALNRPIITDHILINNCTLSGFEVGTFLDGTYQLPAPNPDTWGNGRIKLGTESNGGFRNIAITNCSFMYGCGLALEVVDRGVMENIVVSNITMSHVRDYPIYITTGRRNRGPKDLTAVSSARDIYLSNIVIDDCDPYSSIIICGMEGTPIRNISLDNIRVQYRGGGDASIKTYPELDTRYPEPSQETATPTYGLFARHVDNLKIRNLEFELLSPDDRPDVILDDVTNADIEQIKTVKGY